jgi:hypothetical protein
MASNIEQLKTLLGNYANKFSDEELVSLNDNIGSFILDYGDGMPPEELVLLIAAANYFDAYPGDGFDAYKMDPSALATNNVASGEGGATGETQPGTFAVRLPSPGNGIDRVPVGGIPGWGDTTFLTYDTALAVPHELSHVILGLLGVGGTSELDVATLAYVGKQAIGAATNQDTGEIDLNRVAVELRVLYGYIKDEEGNLIDENGQPNKRVLSTEQKLFMARESGASYENIFNSERNFYSEVAGLSQVPERYRPPERKSRNKRARPVARKSGATGGLAVGAV